MNWKGVFPAVTTKFHPDHTLDLKKFQHNIENQIQAGASGLILGGTLGEASVLSDAEKELLVGAAQEVVGKKIPILMNIASQTTEAACEQVRLGEKNGLDGFMLLPPMRYLADNAETLSYLTTVVRSTSLPFMIYNNPVDYRILVTLDMFEDLARLPNVIAVKESTRDVTNITRMINRFGDRFSIFCGVDTIAMESLVMGAHGWVAGLVCAFPNETVTLFKLIEQGRYHEARDLFRWFLPLLELDIHPKLVQYIKLAETLTGLGTETTRPPRLPIVGEERDMVTKIIMDALVTRPALPKL